ncbi:MAG: hypothetical protein KDC95_07905 [Planctomycetes bacterium]|nr:hypothetical protein [Planctomycetota bacterium]
MRIALLLLSMGLTSFPVLSQVSAVHPKTAVQAGNVDELVPFAWYATRTQQIQDPEGFDGSPRNLVIRSVAFRMARGWANGTFGGFSVDVAVWMSLTPKGVDADTASTNFAANAAPATTQQVIRRRTIQTPRLTTQGFDFKLDFDKGAAFVYPGMITGQSLCLEIRTYGTGMNFYALDAMNEPKTITGSSTVVGSGCQPAGVTKPADLRPYARYTGGLIVGNQGFRYLGNGYKATTPLAIFALGTAKLNAMLPGGCELRTIPIVVQTFATITNDAGVTIPFPIPNVPSLAGASFRTQLFFYERGVTPIDLYTSNALDNVIGGTAALTVSTFHAYDSFNNIDPDKATIATHAFPGRGLVTRYN